MRVTGILLVLCIFSFSLIGCSKLWRTANNVEFEKPAKYVSQQIDITFSPTTLSELEENCDGIVQGILSAKATEVIENHESFPVITFGYTLRTLTISRVHNGNFSIGDKIQFAEYYYKNEKGETVCYENYRPTDTSLEYIFFLEDGTKSGREEIYFPAFFEKGRYPILSDSLSEKNAASYTNQELFLGVGDSAIYREIYADVFEKYINIP